MADSNFNLPPGFRFHPTDEELIVHFLLRKVALLPCHPDVLPDLDLYPYDPWDLNGKAMAESSKWYFYSRRTQSRITESGYWQYMGIDEPIHSSASQKLIGMKKDYAFYTGKPPEGVKTNWIMQEYRLSDSSSICRSSRKRNSKKDYSKWVACRVYEYTCGKEDDDGSELSYLDEVFLSLDDLDEISFPNSINKEKEENMI
ncbi:NAC domain-containing protein 104-like [Olea europaea var. sylvestris]|uniref:NAC domain-containing protein 104-like n=1 Tax=Olea europaea var. sylvestris TaxID=158386 RepID=UPI000C1CCE5D|nr:NAC domain-containing protein 104-like [Olea europaea var. sylvestris]